jgi:superkiller protein 3
MKYVIFCILFLILTFTCSYSQSDKVLAKFEKAIALEQSEPAKAIEIYKEIIQTDPGFKEAYISMVRCYRYMKDYDKAIEVLKKLMKYDKNFPLTYEELGWIYLDKDQKDKSLENFLKAWELSPSNSYAEANLALIYIEKKFYNLGIKHCERAIRLDTSCVPAYNNLGRAYYKLEKYDEAMDCFKKAIELDGNYAWAYSNMGTVCLKKKEYDKAVEQLNIALKICFDGKDTSHVNLFRIYNNLGLAYFEKGQLDMAFLNLQKSIDCDPNNPAPYNNAAWFYAINEINLDKGIELSKKAISFQPDEPVYLDTLAELYYKKKDYNKAIDIIEKAIKLDPKSEYLKEQLKKFKSNL